MLDMNYGLQGVLGGLLLFLLGLAKHENLQENKAAHVNICICASATSTASLTSFMWQASCQL